MSFSRSITDVIEQRFSCRDYRKAPIAEEDRQQLASFIAANQAGPFGSPTRFELIAATKAEREALRGLGTYGFINNPAGFIVGAMGAGDKNLEDFGYAMEYIILFATDLGLGTCWLGGTFTKGRFARQISLEDGEQVPAVTSVGRIAKDAEEHWLRRMAQGRNRKPWNELFFQEAFGTPLLHDEAGAYATPLEMVRVGPSASNKQPWRIVKRGDAWHFYIQRTPGYPNRLVKGLLGIADMQRLDAGIAMCHWQLTANEQGLGGEWQVSEPDIEKPDELTEYIVSWMSES